MSDPRPAALGAHVSRPLVVPESEVNKPHRFWDQQPVPKLRADPSDKLGPLEPERSIQDVRPEPYQLPEGFSWSDMDVENSEQLEEVFNLLYNNYVEDDDACFRFNYSVHCLRWALTAPGYFKNWHVGVRVNGKLVAFISGIPSRIRVHGDVLRMAEINFLCVHKKLRSKRLAPVLIKEVTRRVNLENIWQAVYTAGIFLPSPVAECRYFHRSINIKKLVDVGFSHLPPRQTMPIAERLLALPNDFTITGVRAMKPDDAEQVGKLLNAEFHRRDCRLHPVFDVEDVRHWLLPKSEIVHSYVRVDERGEVSDFFSFYDLPSNVIKPNAKHSDVKAAYSFYIAATSISHEDLLRQSLIAAKNSGFDVLNALDLGPNREAFNALKFGIGDGSLKYYLYNWACPSVGESDCILDSIALSWYRQRLG